MIASEFSKHVFPSSTLCLVLRYLISLDDVFIFARVDKNWLAALRSPLTWSTLVLEMASFLDPRYKTLKFMPVADRSAVHTRVGAEIVKHTDTFAQFRDQDTQNRGLPQNLNAAIGPLIGAAMKPWREGWAVAAYVRGRKRGRPGGRTAGEGELPWLRAEAAFDRELAAIEHAKSTQKQWKRALSETVMFHDDEGGSHVESAAPSAIGAVRDPDRAYWLSLDLVRVTKQVRKDINWYLDQPNPGLEEDPVEWWKDAADKGRVSVHTQKLVKQLLAIPGSRASMTFLEWERQQQDDGQRVFSKKMARWMEEEKKKKNTMEKENEEEKRK
jgi:hypothetical protein